MSMLYVMWEATVLVRQLLALQEGNAVGWMTKESSINFKSGKVFSHLHSIQTPSEASPSFWSVYTWGKAAGPGSKLLISV
jgi:hypothetical protein